MIFVEAKANEIQIPTAKRVANLESWSGADLMISRLAMPCSTHALFMRHVSEGALLVQIKLGGDLAASIGDRLNSSIARMRECTPRTVQHWLVFVGVLLCDAEGSALINGHRTHINMSWVTVDGGICNWIARGGVYYSLSREGLLPHWAQSMERRLEQFHAQQTKYVYNVKDYPDTLPNEQDDPLQLPIRVRDGRVTLLSLPGLGVELVERVWSYCGSLKASLNLLTDVSMAGKIEGVGKGKIEKMRSYFALEDGESLWLPSEVEAITAKAVEKMRALPPVERKSRIAGDIDLMFGKRKGVK